MAKFWKIVGAIIVTLVAITQLIDWLGVFSYKVEVSASEHSMRYPQSWHVFGERLKHDYKLAHEVVAQYEALFDENTEDDAPALSDDDKDIISRAMSIVTDGRPLGLPEEYRGNIYEYYTYIRIENTGRKSANNLILKLRAFSEVAIELPDRETIYEDAENTDRIEVGDLHAGEVITVHAWKLAASTSLESDDIRVIHEDGYTDADVAGFVGPFWVGLARYWLLILLLSVGSGAIVFSVFQLSASRLIVRDLHSDLQETGKVLDDALTRESVTTDKAPPDD